MQTINRAFWIKLARVAAMMDELHEARAALANIRKNYGPATFPDDVAQALDKIGQLLETLAWID